MMPGDDPTAELYRILDRAGLDGANLMDTKRSHLRIVNDVRTHVVMELRAYITLYGMHQFDLGVKSVKVKKEIEVKTDGK